MYLAINLSSDMPSIAHVPKIAKTSIDPIVVSKRDAITQAAIKCVLKRGAANVSVDDIANHAGVSRRTFYRFFEGRRGVMETILLIRMKDNAAKIKAIVDQCRTFEDAIVVGVIESFRITRRDKVYQSISESERILMLELENKVHAETFDAIILSIWGAAFDKAREGGQLRVDISNDDAGEWLVSVMELFRQRDEVVPDPNDAYKIRVLKQFMLPSLMCCANHDKAVLLGGKRVKRRE